MSPVWRTRLLPDVFWVRIMGKCRSFCASLMFVESTFTTSVLRKKLLFVTVRFLPCQIQVDGILICNRNTIISSRAEIFPWLLHVGVNCSTFLFLLIEPMCLHSGWLSFLSTAADRVPGHGCSFISSMPGVTTCMCQVTSLCLLYNVTLLGSITFGIWCWFLILYIFWFLCGTLCLKVETKKIKALHKFSVKCLLRVYQSKVIWNFKINFNISF